MGLKGKIIIFLDLICVGILLSFYCIDFCLFFLSLNWYMWWIISGDKILNIYIKLYMEDKIWIWYICIKLYIMILYFNCIFFVLKYINLLRSDFIGYIVVIIYIDKVVMEMELK